MIPVRHVTVENVSSTVDLVVTKVVTGVTVTTEVHPCFSDKDKSNKNCVHL